MSRFTVDMSTFQLVAAMADGNPGAVTVMAQLYKYGPIIDPDAWSPAAHLLALDDMEIYGPSIWILFKDRCESNVVNVLTLLRCQQLGLLKTEDIQLAAKEEYPLPNHPGFDFVALREMVKAEIPNFVTDFDPDVAYDALLVDKKVYYGGDA